MGLRCGAERLVPPHVATVVPLHLDAGALDDQHLLDAALTTDRAVDRRLECDRRATAIAAIGGHDHLGLGITDP